MAAAVHRRQASGLLYCDPAMKHVRQWHRLLPVAAACALMAGCIYKVNVYQGSIIDPADIDKVEVGMTREQVAYVLGTPTVRDPFHADRWDYVFTTGTLSGERRKVVIHFSDSTVTSVQVTPSSAN